MMEKLRVSLLKKLSMERRKSLGDQSGIENDSLMKMLSGETNSNIRKQSLNEEHKRHGSTLTERGTDAQVNVRDINNSNLTRSKISEDNETHRSILSNDIDFLGFFTIATLSDGKGFGELALLQQKPRMATVRCLEDTHIMVLTKSAVDEAIGKIERRSLNDKVNFLRSIPMFSLLTRNSLAKISCSLQRITIQKN